MLSILLDLFIFLGLIVLVPFMRSINSYGGIKKLFKMPKKDLINYTLVGLYFAITYISFRRTSSEHKFFNYFYFFVITFAIALPFVVKFLLKDEKERRVAAIICGALLLFIPISRFFTYPAIGRSFYSSLPLHVCNLSSIIFLLAVLTKNKTLLNYIAAFGFIGGLITLFVIQFNDGGAGFWKNLNYESCLLHILLLSGSLFLMISGQIEFDYRAMMNNVLWMVPVFVACIFLNQLWNTTFFFTRVTNPRGAFFYNLTPSITLGGFDLNVLFYMWFGALCTIVLHFYAKLLVLLQNRRVATRLEKLKTQALTCVELPISDARESLHIKP